MTLRSRLTRAASLAAAGLVLLSVAAAPASAKSIGQVGSVCSLGSPGYDIFLQQGNDVTLGFGITGAGGNGTWHIFIGEAGLTPIIDRNFTGGPAWTVSTHRVFTPGFHTVDIIGDNLTTGERCSMPLGFRVGGTAGLADITMSGSASAGSVAPGGALTLTFTAKNVGSAVDPGVTFVATLPAAIPASAIQSARTNASQACDVVAATDTVAGTVTCNFGAMDVSLTRTATITLTAPAAVGAYDVVATVITTSLEKSTSDNDASVGVKVK